MIRWALAFAIGVGLAMCGYFMVWDWDKALVGVHNFRQSQTAITAYWFIKDGIDFFNYQTPVMGKPWSIPYEAPFYQVLAAWVTELLHIDLDAAGRAVSVAFWVACLYPLLAILRWWIPDRVVRWAVVLLIWSSPTYLYWSDSFMMESTAMFFGLLYIYALVESLRRNFVPWLSVAVVCGAIGGMQKATTFLIAVVPATGLVLLELHRQRNDGRLMQKLAGLAVAALVPLVALHFWTAHADYLKSLNPLARTFITSVALTQWNFGTLDQRLSPAVWERMMSIEADWGMGRGSTIFLGAVVLLLPFAIWLGKHRVEIIVLVLASLTGDLVFTNLFFIHEYYNYEGSIFLNLAFALAVFDLVELIPIKFAARKGRQAEADEKKSLARTAICCGIFFAIALWGLFTYETGFVWFIAKLPTSGQMRQAVAPVTNAGNPQDVILIYGWDWNPLLPYYSGRKAIMDKEARPLDDPVIQESLAKLAPDQHIAGMMITGQLANNADFVRDRVERLHLNPTPVMLPWGPFYVRAP